jgi:hypothetical protein
LSGAMPGLACQTGPCTALPVVGVLQPCAMSSECTAPAVCGPPAAGAGMIFSAIGITMTCNAPSEGGTTEAGATDSGSSSGGGSTDAPTGG